MTAADLPSLNALLNATAAVFLIAGRAAIRSGNRDRHRRCMIPALAASALFLVSYVIYHYLHGSTPYEGTGVLRWLYFFILVTHIPLAALIVPFCLGAVWHAFRGRFDRHVRITRWLWPVWMYVSATGILIYLMLHVL